jgi:hypothetical protein
MTWTRRVETGWQPGVFLNMLNIFRVVILQDGAELIVMMHGWLAVFQHKFLQYQLFIEWAKSVHAGLQVD